MTTLDQLPAIARTACEAILAADHERFPRALTVIYLHPDDLADLICSTHRPSCIWPRLQDGPRWTLMGRPADAHPDVAPGTVVVRAELVHR